MARTVQTAQIATVDPIWTEVRREAEEVARSEPALAGFIYATILSKDRLEDAVCHRLAQRLNHSDVDAGLIAETFGQVLAARPGLGRAFRADLAVTGPSPDDADLARDRDPDVDVRAVHEARRAVDLDLLSEEAVDRATELQPDRRWDLHSDLVVLLERAVTDRDVPGPARRHAGGDDAAAQRRRDV